MCLYEPFNEVLPVFKIMELKFVWCRYWYPLLKVPERLISWRIKQANGKISGSSRVKICRLPSIPPSHLWEAQEPEDALRDPVEDVDPHAEGGRVDLVQLVEVAVDHGVVGQSVLLPRRHHDLLRHLLARGSLKNGNVYIPVFFLKCKTRWNKRNWIFRTPHIVNLILVTELTCVTMTAVLKIKLTVVITRAVDPVPHGSAFILPPGSGSSG